MSSSPRPGDVAGRRLIMTDVEHVTDPNPYAISPYVTPQRSICGFSDITILRVLALNRDDRSTSVDFCFVCHPEGRRECKEQSRKSRLRLCISPSTGQELIYGFSAGALSPFHADAFPMTIGSRFALCPDWPPHAPSDS